MATAGVGRESENHPWRVLAIFGSGPSGKMHILSVEDAVSLAKQLESYALVAQDRNSGFRPTLRVVDGEGSNLRVDAQAERHLRSV